MSVKELIMELSNLTFEHSESIPSKLFKDLLDKTKEVYDKVEQEEKAEQKVEEKTAYIWRDEEQPTEWHQFDHKYWTDLQSLSYDESILQTQIIREYRSNKRYYENPSNNVYIHQNREERHNLLIRLKMKEKEIVFAKRDLLDFKHYRQIEPYGRISLENETDNDLIRSRNIVERKEQKINELEEEKNKLLRTFDLSHNCRARCKNGKLCKNRPRNYYNDEYGIGFCNRHFISNEDVEERLARHEHYIRDTDLP